MTRCNAGRSGLIAGAADEEGQDLLSPLHYLRQALAPTAELIEVGLTDMLLASPDVIILADVAQLSPEEDAGLQDWVERGGLLVRFRRAAPGRIGPCPRQCPSADAGAPARRGPHRRRRDELGGTQGAARLRRGLALLRPAGAG